MLIKLLAVALGGSIGAMARYAIHVFWVTRASFPLGTLTSNVIGCAAIGVLMAISLRREWPSEPIRLLIVTGLLGSLTTFSTFGYESFELADQGKWTWAIANVIANLILGIGGVALGWGVAARFLGS